MGRTTVEDIKRWIDNRPEGTHHMIVACDTFDHNNYPVYLPKDNDEEDDPSEEGVRKKAQSYNDPNRMSSLMEVYSFTGKHTIEEQLNPIVNVHNYD
jgi:hypothetical protein